MGNLFFISFFNREQKISVHYKIAVNPGFKPGSSDARRDLYANRATTTACWTIFIPRRLSRLKLLSKTMDLRFENVYSALTKSRFLKEHCFCSQLANPSLAGDSSRLHLFVSLSLLSLLSSLSFSFSPLLVKTSNHVRYIFHHFASLDTTWTSRRY